MDTRISHDISLFEHQKNLHRSLYISVQFLGTRISPFPTAGSLHGDHSLAGNFYGTVMSFRRVRFWIRAGASMLV